MIRLRRHSKEKLFLEKDRVFGHLTRLVELWM